MPFDSRTGRRAGQKSSRAGVPNRLTRETAEWLTAFLDGDAELAGADWLALNPWQRWRIRAQIAEFAVPKLSRSEATIDVSNLSDEQIDQLFDKMINRLRDGSE